MSHKQRSGGISAFPLAMLRDHIERDINRVQSACDEMRASLNGCGALEESDRTQLVEMSISLGNAGSKIRVQTQLFQEARGKELTWIKH
jgi:hypothetical protein